MYAYFWYLGDKPSEVRMWNLRGTQKSLIEYGKEDYLRILEKSSQESFSEKQPQNDSGTRSWTLGTHTNPHSLSMFLATERHKKEFRLLLGWRRRELEV